MIADSPLKWDGILFLPRILAIFHFSPIWLRWKWRETYFWKFVCLKYQTWSVVFFSFENRHFFTEVFFRVYGHILCVSYNVNYVRFTNCCTDIVCNIFFQFSSSSFACAWYLITEKKNWFAWFIDNV